MVESDYCADDVGDKVELALEENAALIDAKKPLPTEEDCLKEETDEAVSEAKEEDEVKNEPKPETGEDKADDDVAKTVEEEGGEEEQDVDEDAAAADETDVDDLTNVQLAYESFSTCRLIAEE